jgi:hypothetical protein
LRRRKLRFCEQVLWRILDGARDLPSIWVGPPPAFSGRTEAVFSLLSTLYTDSFYRVHRGFDPSGMEEACALVMGEVDLTRGQLGGFWRDMCVSEIRSHLARRGLDAQVVREWTAAAPY